MLLSCYFRVTFDLDLNAVFNPRCYIASENGQKRLNFGGDFLCVQIDINHATCNFDRLWGVHAGLYFSTLQLLFDSQF